MTPVDSELLPWKSASDHCWAHVGAATAVAKVVEQVKNVPVAQVMTLISSSHPTLMLTPPEPGNRDAVRDFCAAIKDALKLDVSWSTFRQGDFFGLRLKHPTGVVLDVSTFIPVAEPTQFHVE